MAKKKENKKAEGKDTKIKQKETKQEESKKQDKAKQTKKENVEQKETKKEEIKKEEVKQQENNISIENEEEIEEGIQIIEVPILGKQYKFKIPCPFEITEKGQILYETKDGVARLSHLLVFPTAVIKNLDTGEEKLKLAVRKGKEWKEGIFLKSKVYGSPIELANFGIPVNSGNSKVFVKYLAELEAENQDTIPTIETVSKLGWRNGHFVPFSKDCPYEIDIDYKLDKWINAYTSKGTLKEWREEIRPFRKNTIFRFILASSFASVLLEPLGHRIFMVFNWGNSRAGKTSALFSALSVWGNPYNLVMTFNTTAVGVERLAGFYNDLPLALDEKQVNKSQTDLEKIVYMLSSGTSRIRGNKTGGVQAMNSWKTIILATGEETISTTNTTTGVQTRCLEIERKSF